MEVFIPFKNIKQIYQDGSTTIDGVVYSFHKEKEGEIERYPDYCERTNKLFIKDPNGVILVGETTEMGEDDDLSLQKLDEYFESIEE